MARILLGVSGGIAAYKALELARLATLAGHGVRVLMTETATRFVGAASFEGIVGAPVLISEFERRVEEKDFLEFATYSGNRYGTLRSEVERRLGGGHSVVLEIEVQGAQQVRAAKPDSVQIFIAPPDPAVLRERLSGRGTDSAAAIDERLKVAEQELAAQADFDHRVVNDEVERAAAELVSIVRSELGQAPAA